MPLMLRFAILGLGLHWQPVHPGIWRQELPMAAEGPLASISAVAIRIDPGKVSFSLDTVTREFGLRGAWTIDSLPASALVAFNAGQFSGGTPWGWLVLDGSEVHPPGVGSLGMAFVVDSAGRASLLTPGELPPARRHARYAFQSYPALLSEGKEPWELQAPGRGVSLIHRDSRMALGLLADGTVVVALTRFTALGRAGERLPWGPTVPEMAAFMRSLGCVRAMLLDGGISSQLAVRESDRTLARWPNFRSVPLGMVVLPRAR